MSGPSSYTWVDTQDGLSSAVKLLSRARRIAVDTEADSFYHYFHKCCLVQISDGEHVYLIDSVTLRKPAALRELFSSSSIEKVLHAAEQDVLYLRRDFRFELKPVFDTMLAAQLLGKRSVGLAALLSDYFGVHLDKGCQRDDWSRRPLTGRQMAYAAADVRLLLRLRDALQDELEASGRLEWAREEFEFVAGRHRQPRDFDADGFWSLKRARDLAPPAAAVLRELYVMRDGRAREADVPPFRIVSDQTLVELARRAPRTMAALQGMKGFTPLVRRRIGAQVLSAVVRGLAIPEARCPRPPRGQGKRRTAAFRTRVSRLRAWRQDQSTALGLDPGILFPQMTLEALATGGRTGLDNPESIPGLREWRRRLILPEADRLLA